MMLAQRLVALDLVRAGQSPDPQLAAAHTPGTAICVLSDEARENVRTLSGVTRARHVTFASCLGTLAAKAVLRGTGTGLEGLAVIASGWRHHIPMSWEFTRRALTDGPGLVNPLHFPQTLPSSCATTIAAALGSHGPAFGIEARSSGLQSILRYGELLISSGLCTATVVVMASDASKFTAWNEAPWDVWPDRFDFAIAALICKSGEGIPDQDPPLEAIQRILGAIAAESDRD